MLSLSSFYTAQSLLLNAFKVHWSPSCSVTSKFDTLCLVSNTNLIVLIRLFMWASIAPSITFESSLTVFDKSGLENVTRYSSSPTPLLYNLCSLLSVTGSPSSAFQCVSLFY